MLNQRSVGSIGQAAAFDPWVMTPGVALEVADDGVRMYGCLNDDEMRRMQSYSSGVGSQ